MALRACKERLASLTLALVSTSSVAELSAASSAVFKGSNSSPATGSGAVATGAAPSLARAARRNAWALSFELGGQRGDGRHQFPRRLRGALRHRAQLLRDDGDSAPGLARPRGLDAGVQRDELRVPREAVDLRGDLDQLRALRGVPLQGLGAVVDRWDRRGERFARGVACASRIVRFAGDLRVAARRSAQRLARRRLAPLPRVGAPR